MKQIHDRPPAHYGAGEAAALLELQHSDVRLCHYPPGSPHDQYMAVSKQSGEGLPLSAEVALLKVERDGQRLGSTWLVARPALHLLYLLLPLSQCLN